MRPWFLGDRKIDFMGFPTRRRVRRAVIESKRRYVRQRQGLPREAVRRPVWWVMGPPVAGHNLAASCGRWRRCAGSAAESATGLWITITAAADRKHCRDGGRSSVSMGRRFTAPRDTARTPSMKVPAHIGETANALSYKRGLRSPAAREPLTAPKAARSYGRKPLRFSGKALSDCPRRNSPRRWARG